MTSPLNVVPSRTAPATGVRDADELAQALAEVLADTYRLMFKTHAFHWNVKGPLFFSLHKLTEEQYENLFAAADDLAERIRAMGQMAPFTMQQILGASAIDDDDTLPDAGGMCESLAADHEKIARRLHAVVQMAADRNDPVTEDLATQRSSFHEQAVWMLRAISAQ
ncbi:MAG: DNA starvation/stationary phase protection protein [Rhodobacteraceae bacterium]|nr:DNA starvation/stationary phase protection protein [Paracoccaceae bacterium]